MNMFSLKSMIDDILLLVRNNNISESEDLSRAQIATWVLAYKSYLINKKNEKNEEDGEDKSDDSFQTTIGPVELIEEESLDNTCLHRKRTKEKIPELLGDSDANIISVCDQEGCVIQKMNDKRRHYHYFRKYTFGEMTYWYENGYVYVQGLTDLNRLKYIWITGNFVDTTDEDEDSIQIPGWMVPDIKKLIFNNELAFMLSLPSDDDNNSTLSGIKPKGDQQNEK